MSAPVEAHPDTIDRVRLIRGWVIGLAVIAIVLGVVGLLLPGVSLLTVAILFGVYLVASGIHRITTAIADHRFTAGTRLLTGLLGGLIVVAGILCLSNPIRSIATLGIFIGLGWLVEAATGLVAFSSLAGSARWLTLVSSLLSIVAGIVMLILPAFGLRTLVSVGAILLIALGVVVLAELPRRGAPANAAAAL